MLDGTSRGSGDLDGTSRGTGELDVTSRGSQGGAGEEPALAAIGEERPQGGAGEERALGLGSNSSPHMSPTSPGAHEHR